MKLLHEISLPEYNEGRNLCSDCVSIVERTEDSDGSLYVARFLVPGTMAVEGLVSVRGVYEDDTIRFNLANGNGESDTELNRAPINDEGIMGSLMLRDVRVLRIGEGYFQAYGSSRDDDLMAFGAEEQRDLLPVHVTLGGAAGVAARERWRIEQ
jgi:hypothetical protein